jgi:hypothetical protein
MRDEAHRRADAAPPERRDDRIVLTHDRSTLPDFAFSRVENSESMPGVFVVNDRRPVREAIDELLMIDECSEQAEWSGLVVYLPL